MALAFVDQSIDLDVTGPSSARRSRSENGPFRVRRLDRRIPFASIRKIT
jgi:hypothetical protein